MRVIVVVDHAYVNGGLSKVAIDSAIGLACRGHRVDLFASVGPADPSLEREGVAVTLLHQGDETSNDSQLRFGLQWLWNRKAAKALKALAESSDPRDTIVHVHGWAKALSPAIGRALANVGLPVVHTMHDFSLVCPNGGFYDYHARGACGLKPMSAACIAHDCDSRGYHRKLLRVMRHALMQHVSGLADGSQDIITISDLQRQVSQPYLPPGTRLHTLGNPIAVENLGTKPADMPLGDMIFVGRLSPEKGPEVFAEAARRCGIRATFVGDGPLKEGLRASYPDARFLGWRSEAEVHKLMRGARALVFPSVWYEGQPLTVYEALATGTPVLVSDICAGREAVDDGQTGYWFRSGDPASLAEKIALLQDDRRARTMSDEAHRRYWAHPLTLDQHLDELVAIYNLLLIQREQVQTSVAGVPQIAVRQAPQPLA